MIEFRSLIAKSDLPIKAGFALSAAVLASSIVSGVTSVTPWLEAMVLGIWAVLAFSAKTRQKAKPTPASTPSRVPPFDAKTRNWTLDNLPGTAYRYVQRADGTGYFGYISEGSLAMFGVSPAEALEDPERIMGQFHPDDRVELRQIMATAVEHRAEDWWCGRVTTNGTMKWMTITARANVLPTGEICWDGIVLDDTRRQQELVESKRFLDSVIENLPDMVFIKDAEDLKFVFLNRAGEELIGFDRSELIGKSDFDFFPVGEAQHFVDRDRGVLEGREVVEYASEPITTRYRGGRLLHTKKIPLTDSAGKPKFLLGISEDVTDRVHTEEALRESQHRLNAILSHTTTPIFLHDIEGRIILFNESAGNMVCAGVDQILGRLPEECMTPEAARAYRRAELEVRSNGTAVEQEELVELRDGKRTYITIRFPLLDCHGHVYAVGTIATDITERKRIMDEVRRAKEEAEGANLAKSLFLSRMSHELRTPLNAILGFAQLLEFEELPEEQTDAVQFILSSGRHLLRLINEVLDISRIESGNFSISVEPVQVLEVVQEAVGMVRPIADARGIKVLIGDIDEGIYFYADRQRVSQALINLLSNAVKYNRAGGCVEVSFHPDGDREGRIHVLDTGLGIAKENLDRLFVPFDRLGADATDVEGTGLGLSLSRRLVEAMRGEMGLVRTDEHGSVFYIQLPVAAQPSGMRAAPASEGSTVWRQNAG
jgi:PAS domain S-box-containing protein